MFNHCLIISNFCIIGKLSESFIGPFSINGRRSTFSELVDKIGNSRIHQRIPPFNISIGQRTGHQRDLSWGMEHHEYLGQSDHSKGPSGKWTLDWSLFHKNHNILLILCSGKEIFLRLLKSEFFPEQNINKIWWFLWNRDQSSSGHSVRVDYFRSSQFGFKFCVVY